MTESRQPQLENCLEKNIGFKKAIKSQIVINSHFSTDFWCHVILSKCDRKM